MNQRNHHLRFVAAIAGCLLAVAFNTQAQFPGFGGGGNNRGGASSSSARTYPSNTEVGDAMITSYTDTRSLVVVTDEETNEQIKRVIESLDRPRPQVLINCVFLQVTHNNDLDFGAEGSFTHSPAAGQTGTAGTSLGNAAAQLASGGAFYQIVGNDVNLMIHALETEGKTEILSRPSILARNNQQATITVGQQIPIITGTTYNSVTGTPNNQYRYQSIGIILQVTPYINQDNTVEMIVSPQISALSDTKIDIGAGVLVPAIDNRSADTVAVVNSGQTVVIGGLISNQKIQRDTKVPLLGSIPVIGNAFKHKVDSKTKTELLIMITPTVMQRPGQLAKATTSETQKLEMAPKVFEKKDLDRLANGFGEAPAPEQQEESESLQDLRQRALQYMEQQKREQQQQQQQNQPQQ